MVTITPGFSQAQQLLLAVEIEYVSLMLPVLWVFFVEILTPNGRILLLWSAWSTSGYNNDLLEVVCMATPEFRPRRTRFGQTACHHLPCSLFERLLPCLLRDFVVQYYPEVEYLSPCEPLQEIRFNYCHGSEHGLNVVGWQNICERHRIRIIPFVHFNNLIVELLRVALFVDDVIIQEFTAAQNRVYRCF